MAGSINTTNLRNMSGTSVAAGEGHSSSDLQLARMKGAIEATSLGIWEWDIASNDVYWSERQREIFGVSGTEPASYALWLSRIHPEDLNWVEDAARRLLDPESGGQMHLQHRLLLPDGKVRWIESHARMIYHEGRPQRLLGTVTDITSRKTSEETLLHSLAALEVALDAADAVPWQYNVLTREIRWTSRVNKLFDVLNEDDHPTMDQFLNAVHSDDRAALVAIRAQEKAAEPGEKFTVELRLQRNDGSITWVERRSIIGADEADGRWVIGVDLDISARKLASDIQAETLRSLELERERLEVALLTGRLGVYEWNAGDTEVWWSPETFPLYGVTQDTFRPTIESFTALIHPDDREELWRKSKHSIETRSLFEHEYRVVWPNGEMRWIANRSKVSTDPRTGKKRLIGVAVDVTERKLYEENIRLLMREVNHRSKNLLAVVQAVASQSARVTDPAMFSRRFAERLQGLAASHDLLTKELWQSVDLRELVKSQLFHFNGIIGQRIVIDGPPLRLSAPAAQALGMALHELVTNAAKYGALFTQEGTVSVTWTVSSHEFALSWREANGPPVVPPGRKGFGTAVMTDLAENALGGSVVLEFAPGGIEWTLTASLTAIQN
jgi:PAS domain S-box-containing protein